MNRFHPAPSGPVLDTLGKARPPHNHNPELVDLAKKQNTNLQDLEPTNITREFSNAPLRREVRVSFFGWVRIYFSSSAWTALGIPGGTDAR